MYLMRRRINHLRTLELDSRDVQVILNLLDEYPTAWEAAPRIANTIRKQMEKQEMKRAVCILLFNEEGKVLGVSRKDNPDDFGLPGGKVDLGETEEEAVIRELREETGLEITEITKVFQHSAEREYWTSCWTGKINGTIHTTEKGVVKWVEPEMLIQGCFGEYNKLLFESLSNKTDKEFEH
ncbi:MAG TPA: NUDIX hydrolase [Anaerovoracaceae bacterium]|nr:NUDIX hydrolase [Anaerovoracaceae bacterium]